MSIVRRDPRRGRAIARQHFVDVKLRIRIRVEVALTAAALAVPAAIIVGVLR